MNRQTTDYRLQTKDQRPETNISVRRRAKSVGEGEDKRCDKTDRRK